MQSTSHQLDDPSKSIVLESATKRPRLAEELIGLGMGYAEALEFADTLPDVPPLDPTPSQEAALQSMQIDTASPLCGSELDIDRAALLECDGYAEALLRTSREVGVSIVRALQHVAGGTLSEGSFCTTMTLDQELAKFADAAANGRCGFSGGECSLSASEAADAAADVWRGFGGVQGYAVYLRESIDISGADSLLSGGASWQRLVAEVEVAARLAHLPPEASALLGRAALQFGGPSWTQSRQRLEDLAPQLMLGVAFAPLQSRARYVAARTAWALRQQQATAMGWLRSLSSDPACRNYSPLFLEHHRIIESSPSVQELVAMAMEEAVATVAGQLLRNLEATLTAGCCSPLLLLRPRTVCVERVGENTVGTGSGADVSDGIAELRGQVADLATSKGVDPQETPCVGRPGESLGDHRSEARRRVREEWLRRDAGSVAKGGDAAFLDAQLLHCFKVLRGALSSQVIAFAGSALLAFSRRHIDEALASLRVEEVEHGERCS